MTKGDESAEGFVQLVYEKPQKSTNPAASADI